MNGNEPPDPSTPLPSTPSVGLIPGARDDDSDADGDPANR